MYEMNTQEALEADIVDVMMKIMTDDGPAPKNFKNLQKRRNAAEQFTMDHETDFAGTEHSGDRVDTVHHHNQAVPRLTDELDRKKSTVTITTIKANVMDEEFDPRCSACAQIATFNELKKKDLRPKCNKDVVKLRSKASVKTSDMKRRSKGRKSRERRRNTQLSNKKSNEKRFHDRLVGIDKAKSKSDRNPSKSLCKMSKHWVDKSCQYSHASVKRNDSTDCTSTDTTSAKPPAPGSGAANEAELVIIAHQANTTDQAPSNNKQSRDPSVSSYNSFLSIDHEPMDVNP